MRLIHMDLAVLTLIDTHVQIIITKADNEYIVGNVSLFRLAPYDSLMHIFDFHHVYLVVN